MEIRKIVMIRFCSEEVLHGRHPRNRVPSFEFKYIERILKFGNEIEIYTKDQMTRGYQLNDLLSFIRGVKPQAVLISFTTLELAKVEEFIKACKDDAMFFMGVGQGIGLYSAEYSEWLKKNFSLVFAGEPEIAFSKCVRSINRGDDFDCLQQENWMEYSRGKINIVEDVNLLPVLGTSDYEIRNYGYLYPLRINKRLRWGHVLSSRGCPYSCTFCSPIMRRSYGSEFRYRKPQLIAEEVSKLLSFGVNVVSFEGDSFTCSQDRLNHVCKEFLREKLRFSWIAHARVDELSLELVKLMKQSGCVLLRFGIESSHEKTIELIKGNRSGSGEWRDRVENIAFAEKLNPDCIQASLFTIYPGCSMFAGLTQDEKDKILDFDSYHYKKICLNLSNMSNAELMDLQKIFYKRFLLKPRQFFQHFFKFGLFYLRNMNIFRRLFSGFLDFSFRNE